MPTGLCLDAAYPPGNSTQIIDVQQAIPTPHFLYQTDYSTYEIVMSTGDVLSALDLMSKRTSHGYLPLPEHNAPLKLLNKITADLPITKDTELSAYDDDGRYWGLIQLITADILEEGHAMAVRTSTHQAASSVTMQRENFASGAGRRFFDSSHDPILVTTECIVD